MKRIAAFILIISFCSISIVAQDLPISDTTKTVKVQVKQLKKYTGTYNFKQMGVQVEFKLSDKTLVAIVPGTGEFNLKAGSKTAFHIPQLGVQLEFSKDIAGLVKLYQGGGVFDGEKMLLEDITYTRVLAGDESVDYTKLFTPFTAEWELIIREKAVGSATTILRHTVFDGQPAYRAGSTIRYTAMGNMPFDDIGIFAKESFARLWARNAISQENEITSTFNGKSVKQENLNIKTGKLESVSTLEIESPVISSGIYLLLAMKLEKGMAIEFPVMGVSKVAWAKAKIANKETIQTEGGKSFETWRIEFASGTTQWITDEAPYLVKWKMPTGMEWKLKRFGN